MTDPRQLAERIVNLSHPSGKDEDQLIADLDAVDAIVERDRRGSRAARISWLTARLMEFADAVRRESSEVEVTPANEASAR